MKTIFLIIKIRQNCTRVNVLCYVPSVFTSVFPYFERLQEIGLASLGASDEDIEKLSTVGLFPNFVFSLCCWSLRLKHDWTSNIERTGQALLILMAIQCHLVSEVSNSMLICSLLPPFCSCTGSLWSLASASRTAQWRLTALDSCRRMESLWCVCPLCVCVFTH